MLQTWILCRKDLKEMSEVSNDNNLTPAIDAYSCYSQLLTVDRDSLKVSA